MVEKMTVAAFTGPGKIEFREITRPTPKPNQVLVKIKACALCTVERRMWTGVRLSGLGFPTVAGHEASGEVVEVGEQVMQGFKPGDKVVMGVGSDCGACYYCRRGMTQRCINNPKLYGQYISQYEGLPGMWGLGEYRVVNENELFKANGDVPFEQLALSEPVACVTHSMLKLNPALGDDLVVIGTGAMGLFNIMVSKLFGTYTIASDLIPARLERALKVGANAVVDASAGDPVAKVKELTEGRGARFVIAAFGSGKVNEQAVQMLDQAGRFMIFAAAYPPTPLTIDPNTIHHKEIVISGTNGKDANDLRLAAKMISQRMINVAPAIEAVMPFKELTSALDIASRGDTYRVVVKMD
jgi:threonine dehydrogenase-like Zn-dependent dehydrogenase